MSIDQPNLIEPPPAPFSWDKLTMVKCEKCSCKLCFGVNVDTGKQGPLDASATIYVMRRDKAEQRRVQTFRNFMKDVKSIELADGTKLGPDDLRAFASHFNTCPAADFFSKRAKSK